VMVIVMVTVCVLVRAAARNIGHKGVSPAHSGMNVEMGKYMCECLQGVI
jgi:hypothetical protein